jgi:hypothetical protein
MRRVKKPQSQVQTTPRACARCALAFAGERFNHWLCPRCRQLMTVDPVVHFEYLAWFYTDGRWRPSWARDPLGSR